MDGAIGATIVASGEIVVQIAIPCCFPVNNHDSRDIVNISQISAEFLCKISGGLIATTITLIAVLYSIHARFFNQSINCLVSNRFTTANVFFVMCNELCFAVLIDELQNCFQIIVLIHERFDHLNRGRLAELFVGIGQGHGHGVCVNFSHYRHRVGRIGGIGGHPPDCHMPFSMS